MEGKIGMMRRLTAPTSPFQVAANDESLIVFGFDMLHVFCVHCGNLKHGVALFVPGQTKQEYDLKRGLIDQERRCLCKREVKV